MIDLEQLPKAPGCYLFKDDEGKIIYVGKAKSLRKRVSSYFQKNDHDPKTTVLLRHVSDVDVVVTRSEIEAYIYENELIKKHQPRYNINLKDSKNYAYLKLTDETFPRLVMTRQKKGKGSFFGPFISGQERDAIREMIVRTLKLRTCRRMPKKPCLRHHINLCDAPCIGSISEEEYHERIKVAKAILQGNINEVLEQQEELMHTFAKRQQFEQAKALRDRITALKRIRDRQSIDRKRSFDEDIIHYKEHEGSVYLLLFHVYKGTLSTKHEFVLTSSPDILEQFLSQFYAEHDIPKEILLPHEPDPAILSFLSEKRGSKVSAVVPKIGPKRKLLDLVEHNIQVTFFGGMDKVKELGKALGLQEDPLVIEGIDISHISGTSVVGSLVVFRNGRPDKSSYRRFRIRSIEGVDDYAAIAEVVRRRYTRLRDEDGRYPDLILIDGGVGQVHAAARALAEQDISIPLIGLAKRNEEVFSPQVEGPLDVSGKALQVLQAVRDEAHRFALRYNRDLRRKSTGISRTRR